MRSASVLFVLLAADIALFNVFTWLSGTPTRITGRMVAVVTLYGVLSALLWRRKPGAAVLGFIVAMAGALNLVGSTHFMWPMMSVVLTTLSRAAVEIALTIVAPLLVNLAILGVLIKVLHSNNRLERTRVGAPSVSQGGDR
jgi:hypothetical protein